MSLKRVRVEILVEIEPELLSEPDKAVRRRTSAHLLEYSQAVEGVPLACDIQGVTQCGRISDTGSVVITALVDYIVLQMSPGSALQAVGGLVLGVFPTDVDGDRAFSGEFAVRGVAFAGAAFTVVGARE